MITQKCVSSETHQKANGEKEKKGGLHLCRQILLISCTCLIFQNHSLFYMTNIPEIQSRI